MQASERRKVSIIFLSKLNLDKLSLKFLVLTLNKIQQCFEFEFPKVPEYASETLNYNDASIPLSDFAKWVREKGIDGDYFIGIMEGSIGKNWFWGSNGVFATITTRNWEKYFAPPSVHEYILHCIVSVLAVMSDKTGVIRSHHPTRGCCLDYTILKEEDRVDIILGYICDDCKSKIKEKMGEAFLECITKMNTFDWLGEVGEVGSVAYNLKKYFRVDLDKDTGFQKTRAEKAKEYLAGLSKELTAFTLITLIGAFLGFVIGWLFGKR